MRLVIQLNVWWVPFLFPVPFIKQQKLLKKCFLINHNQQ
ncbi:hypothetical protein PPRY_a1135 [Pseudoalteromonas prydzensis ACAM 620]|nr:hypothetical protein [Pseudoalteromonas prydzensis ACAM 620]